MSKKRSLFERFIRIQYGFVAMSIIIIGLGSMTVSVIIDMQGFNGLASNIIGAVGSSILTAGIISFAFEVYMRKTTLDRTKNLVAAGVKEAIPDRYNNIRTSGIVDAYVGLRADKLREKISIVRNAKIRILKIWIDNLMQIEDVLVDAINKRGCTVEIILFNPNSIEAISKRALSLPANTKDSIMKQINLNISVIETIYRRINDKSKLVFKLHTGFIGASVIGIGDSIIGGFYLYGRLSSQGMLLKVCDATRPFYQELDRHYELQKQSAIDYDFDSSTVEGSEA